MKLVDGWRSALKWYSVNIPLVNTAFLAPWALLPQKFQDSLPVPWVIGIAVGLLVLGTVGRLVKQGDE